MTPYLFVFGILSAFAIAEHVKQFRVIRFYFFILSVLMLVLFAGFRQAGVGADDWNYVDKFLAVPDLSYWITGEFRYTFDETWMEPAYILLGSFVRIFTDEYVFLFTTVALFSVGLASYNYYRYTKFVFLVLVLFFVHTYLYRDINQIRSAVAASIGLFLISQIYNREHFKAIITISLAGLFHMASLSLALVYLLSFFKVTRKRLVYGYFIALFLGLIGISSVLLAILPNLGHVTTKLVDYANSGYADSVSLFDITNIKNSFIFFILIYYWHYLVKKVRYFETMMLFYFLAVTWRIAFNDFGIFAARIATFFGVVEVLLVPALLYLFRQKLMVTLIILLYAFLTLYLNLFVKEGRYPYELSFTIF